METPRSLLPLSLLLSICLHSVSATILPFEGHTTSEPHPSRLHRRADSSLSLKNNGNAQYIANATLAGETVRLLLDTGSSDLWVNWETTAPNATDLGQSLGLTYAIGAANGNIHAADMIFAGFTNQDQAFLQVDDASSFSTNIHTQGYDGLLGLGPNEGSQVRSKLKDKKVQTKSYDSPLSRIFQQNSGSDNYITLLLDRASDPSQSFTGTFTIAETVSNYSDITNQPKLDVAEVYKLLEEEQHWQALTDKDNGIIGPDGKVIDYDSIVPKAPSGQLVVVFDSGFTFNQVPRDIADAIYGRVQNAVYDSTNEWWTVPCGQYLNVTFNFGGHSFPIHPLDTVDNNFAITDSSGNSVCIGSFQPITTAFSILGNYDMIMGMSFMRNIYTLMDFGSWADDDNDDDPFLQLLSITDSTEAKAAFVTNRMGGTDSTGDSKYTLLSADQQQSSPVSSEEKKKKYQEMILSRWPYILVGCLVGLILIIGLIVWRCCCRRKNKAKDPSQGLFGPSQPRDSEAYLQLKPSPSQATLGGYDDYGVHHSQKGYMQHQ